MTITPSQADRDAAATFLNRISSHTSCAEQDILDGISDHTPIVQAFAAHAKAAEQAMLERMLTDEAVERAQLAIWEGYEKARTDDELRAVITAAAQGDSP